MTIETVLAAIGEHRRSGDTWAARCPAHDDHDPSLSVAVGDGGKVLLRCHRGCTVNEILTAAGLTWPDLRGDDPNEPEWGGIGWTMRGVGVLTEIWPYHDRHGTEVMQVCKLRAPDGRRQFRQRHRRGDRWDWHAVPEAPVYRWPAVAQAVSDGRTIYICEGEKDADAVRRAGHPATTNPMGANSWKPWHTAALAGAAHVIIVPDRDDAGQRHARAVRDAVVEVVAHVQVAEPLAGKDVSDHLAAGLTLEQLLVVYDSRAPSGRDDGYDIVDYLDMEVAAEDGFVLPSILKATERLWMTGDEGVGKSTLRRQFAVTAALGVPPFVRAVAVERHPQRVLDIDLENGAEMNRDAYRTITRMLGVPDRDHLRIIDRPQGLELCASGDDRDWLRERIVGFRPTLLCLGPWYKLDPELERFEGESTARVLAVLNELRVLGNVALVIEGHMGNEDSGRSPRALRQIGPSILRRWPEFGIGLRRTTPIIPTGASREATVEHWRGPRAIRSWPTTLASDAHLPWIARGWTGIR